MSEGTALARRLRIDINIGTELAENFQELKGLNELKAPISPITQADMHYDGNGWKGYVKTAQEYLVEGNVSVKKDRTTKLLNEVHQFLEDASKAFGGAEIVQFRVYDRDGQLPGQQGWGIVTWTEDGGDAEQKGTVAFSLMPDADRPELTEIANPLNATPVPVIASLSPAGGATAGGTLVVITGAHFDTVTLAAHVKFGANNATSYQVISPSKIAAIAPAGAAATVRVTVTNANGASADTLADDYTYA